MDFSILWPSPPVCTKCLFPKGGKSFYHFRHLQFPRAQRCRITERGRNISRNRKLPQWPQSSKVLNLVGGENKHIWNHHLVLHVEQLQVPIFQRKRSIYDTCIFALKTHTWNMTMMISKFGIIFSKRGLPVSVLRFQWFVCKSKTRTPFPSHNMSQSKKSASTPTGSQKGFCRNIFKENTPATTRCAPTSYKWGYYPYK